VPVATQNPFQIVAKIIALRSTNEGLAFAADLQFACFCQGCGDRGDRAEQHKWIVAGWDEATPLPEGRRLRIDGVDHEGAAANEARGCHATLESMLYETRSNALASPTDVSRELAKQ
jgi:hypothetical protein